ncbi:hypothetical protein RRSWK_06492 [Rhodopirellula sp. SWK7]|nr:hypothetical protein RRSWK_06492 [Rhodopirellula sp. SWK7]
MTIFYQLKKPVTPRQNNRAEKPDSLAVQHLPAANSLIIISEGHDMSMQLKREVSCKSGWQIVAPRNERR